MLLIRISYAAQLVQLVNSRFLVLKAAYLQWMMGEKGLSVGTPKPLTTFAICIEL